MTEKSLYLSSLFGGGAAGLFVDVSLFPLDTLKTRMQSPQGFKKSGGFTGVYRGIGPQVIGSAPQAALFFITYEACKHYATPRVHESALPVVYMASASIGEVMACLVRVPMEVVKQRKQTQCGHSKLSSLAIAVDAYKLEGVKGLYRGFGSTVIREVPFSLIQFPILEYLKNLYKRKLKRDGILEPWEVANCGAVAGGISAAITTPLDVIKTRITLAKTNSITYAEMWRTVYKERGFRGLYAGFVPRVTWITLGGYIFFGCYDFAKQFSNRHLFGNQPLDN